MVDCRVRCLVDGAGKGRQSRSWASARRFVLRERRGSIADGLGSITKRQDYFARDRLIPTHGRREPPLPCRFFTDTDDGLARRAGRSQRSHPYHATGLINLYLNLDYHLRRHRSTDCAGQTRQRFMNGPRCNESGSDWKWLWFARGSVLLWLWWRQRSDLRLRDC